MRNADVAVFCLLLCLVLNTSAENVIKKHKGSPVNTWITNIRKNFQKFGLQVNVSQTILAGTNAEPVPSFVAIETETKICGGVLVYRGIILTAATCIDYVDYGTMLYFGQYSVDNTTDYSVIMIDGYGTAYHPEYNCSNLSNDLAFLFMTGETAKITDSVKYARIYDDTDNTTNFEGKTVYLHGFGTTSAESYVIPNVLQTKTHVVQPISYCQSFEEFKDMDPDNSLCTKSVGEQSGACHGDEGGPVMMEGSNGEKFVIGITSYQPYMCPPSADFPSLHTKLSGYLEWAKRFFNIDDCTLEKKMKQGLIPTLNKKKSFL